MDVDERKPSASGAAAAVAAVEVVYRRDPPHRHWWPTARREVGSAEEPRTRCGKKQDKEDEVDNEDDVYGHIRSLAQASTEVDEEEDIIGEKSR